MAFEQQAVATLSQKVCHQLGSVQTTKACAKFVRSQSIHPTLAAIRAIDVLYKIPTHISLTLSNSQP
jgi:hypothetical protein